MTINGARGFVAYTAGAFLLLLAAGANAGHDEILRGVAEISGCTDPVINGTAIFMEKNSDEGVKEVTVHLQISGLPEGKHAVHIHAVGEEITDELEVAWWFHPKGATPAYAAEYVGLGGVRELQIPPNTITQHQGTMVLKAPAMLPSVRASSRVRANASSSLTAIASSTPERLTSQQRAQTGPFPTGSVGSL